MNDPWKNYLHATAPPTAAAKPGPSAAPRAPAAPTQAKFDQQDERLQKLEAGLAEVQRGHQAMAQQLSSTQVAVEGQVNQVRAELGTFAKDFTSQLLENAEAQQQAQAQQQMQLQLGLQEIKSLLQASPRRASHPSKRAVEPGGQSPPPMELDGQL